MCRLVKPRRYGYSVGYMSLAATNKSNTYLRKSIESNKYFSIEKLYRIMSYSEMNKLDNCYYIYVHIYITYICIIIYVVQVTNFFLLHLFSHQKDEIDKGKR